MTHDLITVVVPVYNMAEYLPRAVDCLLKQSYCHCEILLIDDGSTDDSPRICDDYAARYDCIRVIHKENGGLSSARNTGIDHASGDYIVFPDPDDWTDPDYLRVFISLKEEFHSDLEICGHYVVCANGQHVHNPDAMRTLLTREEALSMVLEGHAFCGFAWNKLYHLDILKANHLRFDVELGMAQDLHFAFRYLMCCQTVSYDPAPCYYYFQHAGGVTNSKASLSARKISGLKTYEKIAEIARQQQYTALERRACATIFNMSMHFMFIYYDSKMRSPETMEVLKKNLQEHKECFFGNPTYSKTHKLLGRLALIHPRLYYMVKRLKAGADA